jgi:hypothetical protein
MSQYPFSVFEEHGWTTAGVSLDLDRPHLVLVSGARWQVQGPGLVLVVIQAFEGPGNVWEGPRKGPHDVTIEQANEGLGRLLEKGIAQAYGDRKPTEKVGVLYVRQGWRVLPESATAPRSIFGRFGAVIRLPS